METIDFKHAYFVKLGIKGVWEKSSIAENKIRVGFKGKTLEEIEQGDWDAIKERHTPSYATKGACTMDINALQVIAESTPEDDVWLTFHGSYLWWCRVGEPGIFEDITSRYRKVAGCWHNQDINGHPLIISQIPGSISKVRSFRGVICAVKEVDDLRRLLNDQPSPTFQAILAARAELVEQVEQGLKPLHWKDFETLVDLVFRSAGWRRKSVLGETIKYVDIELEEPITGDQYQVQVKSSATVEDFEEYAQQFSPGIFRKLYFVVHSPDDKLADYPNQMDGVELILSERLAQMVVDFGLTGWILKKVR